MESSNGRAALDSRGCLPPVAAQAGGGGEATCSADRVQAPPCPVCDAGRWSCHRRVASEGRVACLAGLVRGAYQPRLRGACGMSCEAREGRLPTLLRRRGASYTHTHTPHSSPARDTLPSAGLSSSRVCAAKAGHTQGQCRRDAARRAWLRSAAGTRRRGLAFEKSGMALPATFSLTRAHRRACGGRAAAARLPPS